MNQVPPAGVTPQCLRCTGTVLTATGTAETLTFWSCPSCQRAYTLDGDILTERWRGPLSLTLYGVIFDKHPQVKAAATVGQLSHLDLDRIADEIELELDQPSQPVHKILPGMRATESDLREFLRLVATEIRTQRARQPQPDH